MSKILVTGATGNVGSEVIKHLQKKNQVVRAAVINEADRENVPLEDAVVFDFSDSSTWDAALEDVDKVFLMRPPAISDVQNLMFPFIDYLLEKNIKQIVFLSLQGVQFNVFTPHHKIEKYLKSKNAPYTFLRPNFFMQNLSTMYKDEIKEQDEIFLPAGLGKTAFVDVRDIGEVAAAVLTEDTHQQKAYELSGPESLDYFQVADVMSDVLGRTITYRNPKFKDYKKHLADKGFKDNYIKVQKMLYFVVRHNLSKNTSTGINTVLNRQPTSFRKFVKDYASVWN
jgi:uncharacterized protein YbjT (DUF2867 family)